MTDHTVGKEEKLHIPTKINVRDFVTVKNSFYVYVCFQDKVSLCSAGFPALSVD